MNSDRSDELNSAPLSSRQRLIWIENQLTPKLPTNVEVCYLTVDGELDAAVLKNALEQLCMRHDALRARLSKAPQSLLPELFFDASPDVSFVKLTAETLRSVLARLSRTPFELGKALNRIAVISEGSDRHHIVLVQSHLVTDGRSVVALFEDLERLHAGLTQGNSPPRSQRRFLDHLRTLPPQEDGAQEFWRERLRERPPVAHFYGVAPVPMRGRVARTSRTVPGDVADRLLARAGGLPPSIVMASTTAATVHRVTGDSLVALGVPFLNRSADEMQDVGIYMDVLANRFSLTPEESLGEIGRRLQADAKETRAYRSYTISSSESGHEISLNYYPPAVDRFLHFPAQITFTTALEVQDSLLPVKSTEDAGNGLTIRVFSDSGGRPHEIGFDFDVGRWPDPALHERFATHFMTMLRQSAEDPEQAIGAIDLVTEDERALIQSDSNLAGDFSEPWLDVLDLVRGSAAESPDQEAIVYDDRRVTYAELLTRVEGLAGSMRALGVGPGSLVAVRMERSEVLPVVLLAVLASGAAYVPLDPNHPEDRTRLILADASPALLIVDDVRPELGDLAPCKVVAYSTLQASKSTDAGEPETVGPDATAYVIFTSGSTGRPKGVRVPRRALSAFLLAMRERPGFGRMDRLVAVTTVSFDIAALELFLPLVSGGTVHVAPYSASLNGAVLGRLMAEAKATVFQATPATYRLLLGAGWTGQGVRALCGGEALPDDLARRLIAGCDQLWNMYGPTETTIWSAVEQITPETLPVTIGRAIRGTRLTVRTPQGAHTPPGAPGELNIAGRGVAEGYHGRPDLTAEKFVEDEQGGRRYRTGDYVRRLPDGRISYIGRIDFQVKVRGFRIELGEIEARIGETPGVEAAVVVPFTDASGETALAAYWSGDGRVATAASITAHLSSTLPAYMRPAFFQFLEAMPLTPNGKIDRKALPAPMPSTTQETEAYENDLQRAIAGIWEQVLGRAPSGPSANFFDEGGHSILAMNLVLEIEQSLGVALDLGTVFTAPTLRELTQCIRDGAAGPPAASVTLQSKGQGAPLFCLCGIELYRSLANAVGDDRPVQAIYVEEEANFLAQAASGRIADVSISELALSYARAIARTRPEGPILLTGVSYGGVVAVEVAALLESEGRKIGLVALLDTIRPESHRLHWPSFVREQFSRMFKNPQALAQTIWRRWSQPLAGYVTAADDDAPNVERVREIAFIKAMEQHETAVSLRAPVVLIKAADKSMWGSGRVFLDDYGWGRALGKQVEVLEIPGSHIAILDQPFVTELGHKLKALCAKAEQEGS